MQKFLRIGVIAAALAITGFAETYSGRLLDATCIEQNKSKVCDPAGNSIAFAMEISGKIYRLDDAGNSKAVKALRSRADRQKDPALPVNTVTAKIEGTLDGDILKVDTIDVQ